MAAGLAGSEHANGRRELVLGVFELGLGQLKLVLVIVALELGLVLRHGLCLELGLELSDLLIGI